jgi:hypothetical protein
MATKIGKGGVRKPSEPSRRVPPPDTGEEAHLPWKRRNYLILAAGGGVIVVGFILLAVGDKSFAPLLLVGGYLGLIPWGILASERKKGTDKHQKGDGE